jgi:hypothetical protein
MCLIGCGLEVHALGSRIGSAARNDGTGRNLPRSIKAQPRIIPLSSERAIYFSKFWIVLPRPSGVFGRGRRTARSEEETPGRWQSPIGAQYRALQKNWRQNRKCPVRKAAGSSILSGGMNHEVNRYRRRGDIGPFDRCLRAPERIRRHNLREPHHSGRRVHKLAAQRLPF